MKVFKKLTSIVLIFVLALSLFIKTEAATATKVTGKVIRSGGYEHLRVRGLTKKGKVVWTYNTPNSYQGAQLDSAGYTVKGSYVYITYKVYNKATGYYVRLKKSTGKVLKKKSTKYVMPGPALGAYGTTLYSVGYLDDYIYRFNSKGTMTGKYKYSSSYYWPYKIVAYKSYIKVTFEAPTTKTIKISTSKFK